MVAGTNSHFASATWWINNCYAGFCTCAIHLCNILSGYSQIEIYSSVAKKGKVKIKKKKKRIPVPKKPPKVEKNPKAYDRKKSKRKLRKKLKEELPKDD